MRRTLPVFVLLAAFWMANCSTNDDEALPLETQSASLTASENIKNTLTTLSDMLAFLEESDLVEDAFGTMEGNTMICEPARVPENGEEPGEPVCYEEEPEELEIDLSEAANDIASWLDETIFVDSQLESDSGNVLVYLLDPAIVCAEEDEYEEDMEACQDFFTKIPVRVKVQSHSAGNLDLEVLFGAAQVAPVAFQVYTDKLTIDIDLAKVRTVAEMILNEMGDEEMDAQLPDTFTGSVRIALEKLNDNQMQMKWSIEKSVHVAMTIEGSTYDMTLAKSSLTAMVDKAAQSISLDVDMGALAASFPYQDFINAMWDEGEEEWDEEYTDYPDEPRPYDDIVDEDVPQVTGTMALHLAGLTGAATFQADDEAVTITGLGLGGETSTLKKDATTLASIALNKDAGRTFDLDLSVDGDDVVLAVAPLFDLQVMFGFASVANDFPEELPQFMANDTMGVTLDGADAPTVRFSDAYDALVVEAGQLALTSSAMPEDNVTVTEGNCLFGVEDEDDEYWGEEEGEGGEEPMPENEEEEDAGHELLSNLYADTCQ